MAWKKTQKGRIIYDRKIHPFTIRDLVRIGRQTPAFVVLAAPESYNTLMNVLEDFIVAVEDPGISYGGGEFGGGGATREFGSHGLPLQDLPRVTMIVENI